jgi:hypothetical protein
VGGERVGDDPGEQNGPPGPWRLRVRADLGPGRDLPLDSRRAAEEVDVLDPECEQLADAQPEPDLGDHHCPVARRHRVGEGQDLLDRERDDAGALGRGSATRTTGEDATSRSRTALAAIERSSETSP